MIILHVNAARVEKVVFRPRSAMELDFDQATWLVIQRHVDQMNLDLQEAAEHALEGREDREIGR